MMIRGLHRALSLLGLLLGALVMTAPGSLAASSCPGDYNNDGKVTIDELVLAVNAALNGCGSVSAPSLSTLLKTGQTTCDQGSATLGPCPGSPLGQDGAVGAGVSLAYKDNGDGTISDLASGLMWEKLSDDNSIHDWDNTYTWNDAFDVKVAALNTAPCFAGHCDWRLPNRRELDSLLDLGQVLSPAVNPVFNSNCTTDCSVTQCSCTQPTNYWSSTTYQDPAFAWCVDYDVGSIDGFEKTLEFPVRAVRGGV